MSLVISEIQVYFKLQFFFTQEKACYCDSQAIFVVIVILDSYTGSEIINLRQMSHFCGSFELSYFALFQEMLEISVILAPVSLVRPVIHVR